MTESGGNGNGAKPAPNGGGEAVPGGSGVQHSRSFKLRFAAQREQGRSYVSLVKPLGLPATVTGKFYSRPPAPEGEPETRALRRIQNLFQLGPRERFSAPITESHVYGWWGGKGEARDDPRLSHHIRDSAWLKARLLVLAADDKIKRK